MQTVGWFVGTDGWAFTFLVEHVIKGMPDYKHKINEPGDINVLLYPDLFKQYSHLPNLILHLDGNRWYENFGIKFGI
jgi:hypothetical protein